MPLIQGSKSANDKLLDLVYKRDEDMAKMTGRVEVTAIKSWMDKQLHLPTLTDEQIVLFLHSCFYSIERTKDTIDNYYTFRTHAPEMYTHRNPHTDIHKVLKVVHFSLIPPQYKTPEGHNIVVLRLREFEASKFDFPTIIKAGMGVLDYFIGSTPLTEGIRCVFDMKHITLQHVAKINLSVLKKLMMFIQEALPTRLRGLHVLNTFPLINQILALVKPLMKQELIDILYLHTPADLEDFKLRFVPNSVLPSDYGGDLKSVEHYHSELCKNLLTAKDWLEEIEAYRVDESRRTGKARRASDVYGMEGSFKKLDLD